jgi:hypothetical protein
MSLFKERYCSKHGRIFYGFRCPQCIKDEENKQLEKILEPITEPQQKKEAQQQLRRILAELEKAKLIKETPNYKLFVCPFCHQQSLFFYKPTGKYECLNGLDGKCPLNSTIRALTQKINR